MTKFKHSWAQFSVIAHINGTSPSAPLVILGAHEDSMNLYHPSTGRAPGADDDGSGTVNLLEVFRALVAAGFRPAAPVEFHWYSGEEAGLLGSQAVAKAYKKGGKDIRAMLELDMTGYFAPGTKEVIALEADYMDAGETSFLKRLVETYSVLDWAMDAPVRAVLSAWTFFSGLTVRRVGSVGTRARTIRAGTGRDTRLGCSMRRLQATTIRMSTALAIRPPSRAFRGAIPWSSRRLRWRTCTSWRFRVVEGGSWICEWDYTQAIHIVVEETVMILIFSPWQEKASR